MQNVYEELELASGFEEDYLEHHGVLGMHWGVRRYQKADGTYTKEGLARYNDSKNKYVDAKKKYKKSRSELAEAYNSPFKSHHEKTYKEEKRQLKDIARKEYKKAKKDLNKSYDDIKKDYRADKGKKLVDKSTNHNVAKDIQLTKEAARDSAHAAIAIGILGRINKAVGNKTLGNIMYGVAAGEAITAGVLSAEGHTMIRDLDAYYEKNNK